MSRRHFIASLSTLLCVAPFLEGVVVNNETDLNNAIIAANAAGDPSIQLGSNISYSQLLQPLNTNNVLVSQNNPFTIDGQGNILSAAGTFPGFFARQSTGTVTIQNLTIDGAHAKGGNGGNPRGGGAIGAGGGLFLNTGSTVVLDNVSFQGCQASGGNGGSSGGSSGGGGGGLYGNGGSGAPLLGGGGAGLIGVSAPVAMEVMEEVDLVVAAVPLVFLLLEETAALVAPVVARPLVMEASAAAVAVAAVLVLADLELAMVMPQMAAAERPWELTSSFKMAQR